MSIKYLTTPIVLMITSSVEGIETLIVIDFIYELYFLSVISKLFELT